MTSRKSFLIASAAVAAALPAVAEAAPASATTPAAKPGDVDWPKFPFDLKAFDAQLNGPQPHKHLFTSVEIEHGTVLAMVGNTMMAYDDLSVAADTVLPAAVLYHSSGVLLGFDDHIWDTYVLPASKKPALIPRMKPVLEQITSYVKPDQKGNPATGKIAEQTKKFGLRIYLCNEATRGFAEYIATQLNLKPLDVYAEMATHLQPNTMLTPTGVWAVHAVQQRGFTLLPVTVA